MCFVCLVYFEVKSIPDPCKSKRKLIDFDSINIRPWSSTWAATQYSDFRLVSCINMSCFTDCNKLDFILGTDILCDYSFYHLMKSK